MKNSPATTVSPTSSAELDDLDPADDRSFLDPAPKADQSALAELRRGGIELERNPLLAVHDDELEAYLRSLGLIDNRGPLVACKFCSEHVAVDHVFAVFPLGGSIKIACDKPECQSALLEAIRQREVRL